MNSDDLTKDSLSQLAADALSCKGFYRRLVARMEQRGFPREDKLLAARPHR